MAINNIIHSPLITYFGMDIYGSDYDADYFEAYYYAACRAHDTADGGDDQLSGILDGRNSFCDEIPCFLDELSLKAMSTPDSLSNSLSVECLGLEKYGFIDAPDSLSKSLSVEYLGLERYGFVSTPDILSNSLSVGSLGLEKYGFISTPDILSNSLSVESLGLEKYGFISTPDILSNSLSVEYLGLERYGFISTPDSLLKSLSIGSLGLEKYGFVEAYEAETTEQGEEEDEENSVSSKSCVGLSCVDRLFQFVEKDSCWGELIQEGVEDEDSDERYKWFSKNLKVSIPAPEKYEDCDIEAINFLSSYYPTKSRGV